MARNLNLDATDLKTLFNVFNHVKSVKIINHNEAIIE